jgi:hypothetical protein
MINISKARWKAVSKYSAKTGEFIETYPSITIAAKKNGIRRQTLNSYITGKYKYKSIKGYLWLYAKDYKHDDQKKCCRCRVELTDENKSYARYNVCIECHKIFKKERLNHVNDFVGKIYRRNVGTARKTGKEILYSLEEFLEWISKNDQFFKMYRIWVQDKQNKGLTPHIARIDPSKSYTLDNLEVLSKKQWRRKMFKPIEQWNKEKTVLICTYDSIVEAERATGVITSEIVGVAKKRVVKKKGKKPYVMRSGGGYYWKYSGQFKEIK